MRLRDARARCRAARLRELFAPALRYALRRRDEAMLLYAAIC